MTYFGSGFGFFTDLLSRTADLAALFLPPVLLLVTCMIARWMRDP